MNFFPKASLLGRQRLPRMTFSLDGTTVACMVDLLVTLTKRSSTSQTVAIYTSTAAASNPQFHQEVDLLYGQLVAGEISKNEIDSISDLSVLWHGVVKVLDAASIFTFNEEDVCFEASNLPNHIVRFLGALFPTLETLMGNQKSDAVYFVKTLQASLMNNRPAGNIVQIFKEYRSLFSFSYMFNRRTSKYPNSIVDEIASIISEMTQAEARIGETTAPEQTKTKGADEQVLDDSMDDDELLLPTSFSSGSKPPLKSHSDDNVLGYMAPNIPAPSIAPLNSNIDFDTLAKELDILNDNSYYTPSTPSSPTANKASSSATDDMLQPQTNDMGENIAAPRLTRTTSREDEAFSLTEDSILNSYYNYQGWNLTQVEEDEDSENSDSGEF